MRHRTIEQTYHTFNPWTECQRMSPEAMARKALTPRPRPHNLGRPTPPTRDPQAPRRVTSDAYWRQPMRWNRAAREAGEWPEVRRG